MKPKLRFPQFSSNWEAKRIDEVTKKVSLPVKVNASELYQQIGIRSHGKGLFHKEFVTGESLGNKRVFWVEENCFVVNIVFAWEQAVAKTTKAEVGMIASHRFPMFKPLENTLDVDFLLTLFLTKKGKALLELASPGGAGRNKTLGQSEFAKLKINIPTLPEQQKIAAFLRAVDEKIKQLAKKKDLLYQYKKGVMQKIFNQEIRFKDDNGNDFADWGAKKLGEVCRLLYGKDQKQISDVNGKYPILGTGGFMGKTNSFLYDKPSVLIGRKGTIDKPRYLESPFWVVDTVFYTEIFGNTFPKWLFYRFQIINWYLYNEASGVPSLSSSTISKIKIRLPCIKEQTKIANFLSAIDEKIDLVNQQLENIQTFKTGLLQQMFV